MKSFKQWLVETSPANVSVGLGIRGLGDVTGTPGGDISNYAAANAAEAPKPFTNTVDGVIGYEGGDTKDQILGKRSKAKK